MKLDLSRFIGKYRQETRDNLNIFDAILIKLESSGSVEGEQFEGVINDLLRVTHSMKGGARMLGLKSINELCHNLEEFIISIRSEGRVTQSYIDLIVECRKSIENLLISASDTTEPSADLPIWLQDLIVKLTTAKDQITSLPKEPSPVAEKLGQPVEEPKTRVEPPKIAADWRDTSVRVDVEAIDDILHYGYEMSHSIVGLKKTQDRLDEIRAELDAKLDRMDEKYQKLDKDDLVKVLQDLTMITYNLRERIAEIDRNVRQIDSNASELRMRPLSELFATIPLQVRELTRGLNKEVDVEWTGESVRLDGQIVELLKEPLLHIIRNAIDHGIETTEDREKIGKPRRGKLMISAFENAGWSRIIISDDGKGIDLHSVWKQAKKLGLTKEQPSLDNLNVGYNFLFDDRFTSKSSATDVSGRGVGMAVVKRRMQELRGEVFIESKLGYGTKIILSMPTSLSSQRALIVQSRYDHNAAYFGIPTALIKEIVNLRRTSLTPENPTIFSSEVCQPLSLSQIIVGKIASPMDFEDYAILCSDETNVGAFAVERIVAETEVEVHSLPEIARQAGLIAGASVLTTEELMLILNVPAILNMIALRTNADGNLKY